MSVLERGNAEQGNVIQMLGKYRKEVDYSKIAKHIKDIKKCGTLL